MISGTLPEKHVGGNTGNSRHAAKNWCWTLGVDQFEREKMHKLLEKKCAKFEYQIEVAPTTGWRHYQGRFCLEKKERLTGIKKWLGETVHLEVERDSESEYCRKEETAEEGPWISGYPRIREQLVTPEWRPWQAEVIQLIDKKPDDRTIYYVWGQGCDGKDTLAGWLVRTYNGTFLSGAAKDMMYVAMKTEADLYVVNESRADAVRDERLDWSGLEYIKNGRFCSTKYECVSVNRRYNVHILVLANRPPDMRMLTADRWKIIRIS